MGSIFVLFHSWCLSSSIVRLTWCRPNVCRQSWQMYEVQLTAPSTADPARKDTFAEPHDGHVTPFSSGGRSFFTRFCSITSPSLPSKIQWPNSGCTSPAYSFGSCPVLSSCTCHCRPASSVVRPFVNGSAGTRVALFFSESRG